MVDNKISNKKVRTSFNNIRKVKSLIAKRCLLFVGKIIRPNTTVRHSILDDIWKIIPSVDKYGSFKIEHI